MMPSRIFLCLSLLLGFAGIVVVLPDSALAAGVVGTGTAASCTDAAFNTALTSGGLVTFNCGTAPVTIDISTGTGTKTISVNTTIDGSTGQITISGGNSVPVFVVNASTTLNLRNLTVAHGNAAGSVGGGVLNNGTLNVTNSTFDHNSADFGGGLFNRASAPSRAAPSPATARSTTAAPSSTKLL
jgi:hypothetical protein